MCIRIYSLPYHSKLVAGVSISLHNTPFGVGEVTCKLSGAYMGCVAVRIDSKVGDVAVVVPSRLYSRTRLPVHSTTISVGSSFEC